jgi:Trypsin-like peptidase domain
MGNVARSDGDRRAGPRHARWLIALLGPAIMALALIGAPRAQAPEPRQGLASSDPVLDLVVMISAVVDKQEGIGAGVIFGAAGDRLYVATANHLVRRGGVDAQQIRVRFRSLPGEPVPARLLADLDPGLDLAVLSVAGLKGIGLDLAALRFDRIGKPDVLKRGDGVFAIGQPGGNRWRLSVSPDRVARVTGDVVQFESTFIAAGHSGGALLNQQGQIVGMIRRDQPPDGEAVSLARVLERVGEWGYPVSLGRQRPDEILGTWIDEKFVYAGRPRKLTVAFQKRFRDRLFGNVVIAAVPDDRAYVLGLGILDRRLPLVGTVDADTVTFTVELPGEQEPFRLEFQATVATDRLEGVAIFKDGPLAFTATRTSAGR